MKGNEIQSFNSRPRFNQKVKAPVEEVINCFQIALNQADKSITGQVVQHHIFLKIKPAEELFWSPQLHLQIEVDEENEGITQIRGLYSPKPAIWTFFIFLYAAASALTLGFSFWGLTLLSLEQNAWPLWGSLLGVLALLATYFAALLGQKIGLPHSLALHNFYERALQNIDYK